MPVKPVNEAPNNALIRTFRITDFRNAETILRECVKDIDDGYWVCGTLFSTTMTSTAGIRKAKPEGCAMGLVALNSGVAPIYEYRNAKGGLFWMANDADHGDAMQWTSQDAAKALIALAETIDEDEAGPSDSWKNHESIDEALLNSYVVGSAQDAVIEHNDGVCQGRLEAREWFIRAAEYAAKNHF